MNSEIFYDKISENVLNENDFSADFNILYSRDRATIPNERLFLSYKRLLESAAILACSKNENHKSVALSIVSEMMENKIDHQSIHAAIELIFLRLGVFPGLSLSITDYGYADYMNIWNGGKTRKLTPALASEVLGKEITNRIKMEDTFTFLTDFQAQVLQFLNEKKNISISAPTSAGKSHVLKQYIIECLKKNNEFIAIYIVPTRALISQVQSDLKQSLKTHDLSEIDVYTSSFEVVGEGKKEYDKVIMVLTQERLQTIEGKCDKLDVDLLIVDEAQKVEKGARGILLEDSIQQIISWNPKSQYVFISPFTENPEKIGKVFNCPNVEVIHSHFSPVNQNLFLVDEVENDIEIALFNKELRKKIMTYTYPVRQKIPVASYKRKGWVAINLIKEAPTMIYCNDPGQCKKTAGYLSEQKDIQAVNPEVIEVISYLSKHIHKEYYLIDYLKRGIAYHYGSVPASVRRAVETLFENKSIDYICCTSTLMEGVNFPAKNIILHNPRIGKEEMKALDYLNVAGRAGRLMKDFNGNIYAIDIDKWPGFKPHLEDRKHMITSSMETVISEKKDTIIQHLREYIKSRNNKDVEAAVTRFIMKEVKKGNKEFVGQLLERNTDLIEKDLDLIVDHLKEIVDKLVIPGPVILNNLSIDPRLQNSLYLELSKLSIPPIPRHPSTGSRFYDQMAAILSLTNKYFQRGWSEAQIRMFNMFTCEWAREKSLGEMINRQINYTEKNNNGSLTKKQINDVIDDVIKLVNNTVRFEIHRDISAYINILSFINQEKGLNLNIDEKVGYYLELGASTPTTITIINNGLPRTSALILKKYLRSDIRDFKTIQKELVTHLDEIKKELPSFMIEGLFY